MLEATSTDRSGTVRDLSTACGSQHCRVRRALCCPGGDPKVLEGSDRVPRSVLLEFDSPERAMEWYNSPQHQEALKIRLRSATPKSVDRFRRGLTGATEPAPATPVSTTR